MASNDGHGEVAVGYIDPNPASRQKSIEKDFMDRIRAQVREEMQRTTDPATRPGFSSPEDAE